MGGIVDVYRRHDAPDEPQRVCLMCMGTRLVIIDASASASGYDENATCPECDGYGFTGGDRSMPPPIGGKQKVSLSDG